MSQPTTKNDNLKDLLERFLHGLQANALDESLLSLIRAAAGQASNPDELRSIAQQSLDRYFAVDMETMILVLHRWVEMEPDNKEAKGWLGTYLLSHGPDWDFEAQRLLEEAQSCPR